MNSWPLKQLAVGNDSECVYRAVAATLRPVFLADTTAGIGSPFTPYSLGSFALNIPEHEKCGGLLLERLRAGPQSSRFRKTLMRG